VPVIQFLICFVVVEVCVCVYLKNRLCICVYWVTASVCVSQCVCVLYTVCGVYGGELKLITKQDMLFFKLTAVEYKRGSIYKQKHPGMCSRL
jgi:hypothetical protein